MQTIFRGPGFDDCYIALVSTGAIYLAPLIPIAENDDLTVGGEVKVYDGDPIEIYHGETLVGTVSNSGPFTRQFTAADDGNEVTIRPTGTSEHQLGYLQIVKDAE